MKQAVLKSEAGEPIRLKKKINPIDNDSFQTNALSEKMKPEETVLEKPYRLRREKNKDEEEEEDNEWNDSGNYNKNVFLPERALEKVAEDEEKAAEDKEKVKEEEHSTLMDDALGGSIPSIVSIIGIFFR